MEWTLTRILGRFIKAGICREAAYLNNGLHRIGHKAGLPVNPAVISKKMKTLSFRTIFVGLLLALGSFYLLTFMHTLLDMLTQIRLKKPLNAYLF
jgi:hypothetical protein